MLTDADAPCFAALMFQRAPRHFFTRAHATYDITLRGAVILLLQQRDMRDSAKSAPCALRAPYAQRCLRQHIMLLPRSNMMMPFTPHTRCLRHMLRYASPRYYADAAKRRCRFAATLMPPLLMLDA